MTTTAPSSASADPGRFHTVADTATMVRRNLRRMRRYPSMTVMLVGQPLVFLLLFVFVFGGTLGDGLPGSAGSGGREAYLTYLTPGILLMAVASVSLGTAVSVAMDMTEGIIGRFRTMDIAPSSVLSGHVVGALLQTTIALVVTVAVAAALGFRASAGLGGWLAAAGLLLAFGLALTWLTVAIGLAAKSVESASNTPTLLVLLPFLGSGFVPTESLPGWLRVFADNQPFTPVTEALRSLLAGTPVGQDGWVAVLWCVVLVALGRAWAKRLYARERTR